MSPNLQELKEDRRAMVAVGLAAVILLAMVAAGGLIYRDKGEADKTVGLSTHIEIEEVDGVEVSVAESTYLVFDFGPRVMFYFNRNGVVVGVFRLNNEAGIFFNADFVGMNLRDAMNKMVGVAIGRGYLAEAGEITASVMDRGSREYFEEAIGVFEGNNIAVMRLELHKIQQAEISVIRWNYVEGEVIAEGGTEGPDVADTGGEESGSGENGGSSGGSVEPPPVVVVEKTFTATFHGNGATVGVGALSCKTTGNSCAVVAPSIVREGYEIFGWSTSVLGVWLTDAGSNITLTGDATYYAITMGEAGFMEASGMLPMVNEERGRVGAGSLSMSRSLTYSAKVRAKEICTSVSHTRPDGSSWTTVNPLAYGENLAGGLSTVAGTFGQWMASEGHRNNMMNSTFRTVGIAGYHCPEGEYRYYWVQLFGR